MVLTLRISLLFFALTSLQVVSSTRFKIAIPVEERERVQAHLAKRAGDACADYEFNDTANLYYPDGFQHLQKPWDENPNTTVATSPTVTAGINRLQMMKVPGLNGVTIEEVIDELQQRGCLSFPFGGSVRDQFLDASPADLDMETNCAPETILSICEAAWGASNCDRFSGSMIVHIGNSMATDGETDVIDASNWNGTFFGSGIALEYTTNSMAYFGDGLKIIIDITGHGINDTCDKNIRIPVDLNLRKNWSSTIKVYRFWKLRAKGYTAIDSDTLSFIVSEAEQSISDNSAGFQSFYCKNALTGQWMSSNATCVIPKDSCEGALSKKEQYDTAFEMDLGDFWNNEARALVQGLECDSCSATAGEDTCDGSVSVTPSTAILWGIIATVFLVVAQ